MAVSKFKSESLGIIVFPIPVSTMTIAEYKEKYGIDLNDYFYGDSGTFIKNNLPYKIFVLADTRPFGYRDGSGTAPIIPVTAICPMRNATGLCLSPTCVYDADSDEFLADYGLLIDMDNDSVAYVKSND